MAELFYSSDQVELWHGDAMDVLPGVKKESYDLVLTDPPYGVAFESNMRAEKFGGISGDGKDEEARESVLAVLEECVRLVGQNRHLYVFGPEVLRAADMKVSKPAELIWVKQEGPGMGDLGLPWGPQHEPLHFYTSLHRHAGKRGKENNPVRIRKGTVLRAVKPTGFKVRHPSEKPVWGLLSELIESSSRAGETILDPFSGVGSTGVAAVLTGRKAVLVELEERYCEIAAERISAAEKTWAEMQKA